MCPVEFHVMFMGMLLVALQKYTICGVDLMAMTAIRMMKDMDMHTRISGYHFRRREFVFSSAQ